MITKNIFVLPLVILLCACGGTAEKPVSLSISSPEKLLNHGIFEYNNNNYQKATEDFEKALLQYRSIDSQTGIAASCLNLAKTNMAVNNNNIANGYLDKAEKVITESSLTEMSEHLHLLQSSLAIKNKSYQNAQQYLDPLLNSQNSNIKLAALKNRNRIAFLNNADDKQLWLEKYRTLQKNKPEETQAHLASIYRFDAELAKNDEDKQALLSQALTIYRQLADRPAIAATLVQSAQIETHSKQYKTAEDKLLRALFIRHQLGDVNNTVDLLTRLDNIYNETESDRQKLTKKWLALLSRNDLTTWDDLFKDFENYPVAE